MARIASTPSTILQRTLVRLKAVVAACTDSNTYISTVSNELPPNPSDVMFEVALGHNFQFWQPELVGAGENSIHTAASIVVTIHTQMQLDEVGRDLQYLTHSTLGVVKHLTSVLGALTNHDLVDGSGNQILAQPMRPSQGQVPPKDDRKRGFVSLIFDIEFDWSVA